MSEIYQTIPQPGAFHPQRVNQYVKAMAMAASVHNGPVRVDFGAPALADTDAIVTQAQDLEADNAKTLTSFLGAIGSAAPAPYGRNITATAGAAVGSGTSVVITINGFDYLHQPMTETITVAHADGTNTIAGKKAFYGPTSIASDGGGSVDTYILIGYGALLGLPFRAIKVFTEEADGVPDGTLGSLVAGVLTDPQTATTGDPRGTYDPHTTLDGSANVTATFLFDSYVNASGNGGLHGIKHYSA
jgi:hypothetical protein